jgi:hypothetical protein
MTGTNTTRGSNSSQETKDRSEQDTTEERGDIQDKSPDGEEEQEKGATGTIEIGRGNKRNYIKCYSKRARSD